MCTCVCRVTSIYLYDVSTAILKEARSAGDGALFDTLMPGMSEEEKEYIKEHGPAMWAMLDNMAAQNPQAYKEYIRSQIEANVADKAGRRTVVPLPGFCLRGVVASIVASTAPKSSQSAAAGVQDPARPVLPADIKPSAPLFFNVCSHEAVAAPKTPSGASVLGDAGSKKQPPGAARPTGEDSLRSFSLQQLLNLEIPLVVGAVRAVRGTGASLWQGLRVCVCVCMCSSVYLCKCNNNT
jgi:hypothetical protein